MRCKLLTIFYFRKEKQLKFALKKIMFEGINDKVNASKFGKFFKLEGEYSGAMYAAPFSINAAPSQSFHTCFDILLLGILGGVLLCQSSKLCFNLHHCFQSQLISTCFAFLCFSCGTLLPSPITSASHRAWYQPHYRV